MKCHGKDHHENLITITTIMKFLRVHSRECDEIISRTCNIFNENYPDSQAMNKTKFVFDSYRSIGSVIGQK